MDQCEPYNDEEDYDEKNSCEKPRTVGYIRVSSQGQIRSLEGQRRELEAYCQAHGLNLPPPTEEP
ncbi:MAG: recombinase family protein [Chloroflexi bacterium]|nr:recombinase family protein [Chloroflexota bacterium]